MASQAAITLKNANAVEAIQKASTALADKFKLEIKPFPDVRRFDTELGRAMQLEHLGEVLTQVAEASGSLGKAAKKVEEPQQVEAAEEVASIEAEQSQTEVEPVEVEAAEPTKEDKKRK